MNSSAIRPADSTLPSMAWWVLLGMPLAVLVACGPLVGVASGLVLLLFRNRPLEFSLAYVVTVVGASFVDYTLGGLTPQLALLTVALMFVLFCYALPSEHPHLALPRTVITAPMALYLGLTIANWVRGVLVGNSLRYGGLELIAGLGLGTCFMVSNREFRARDLRYLEKWLLILGFGHVVLGFYWFSLLRVRTGRLSFTPVPGLIALLFLNLALRARSGRARLGWLLALLPLLLHQFMSFTRGYWVAMAVGAVYSVAVYVGRGEGSSLRLRNAATIGLLVVVPAVVGAGGLAAAFGISNLVEEFGNRVSSSFATDFTYEAGSNVYRLVEYAQAWLEVLRAPWLGHGLGYAWVVREPLHNELVEEWVAHNNYLSVWIQQGLIGLSLFVWALTAGVAMGFHGRRQADPVRAAWCTGTSAATLYVLVYGMVHFPLAEVNTTFTLALLWGVTMSIMATGRHVVRWRATRAYPSYTGNVTGGHEDRGREAGHRATEATQ